MANQEDKILTEEEKKEILRNVYGYSDDRYITTKEIEELKEMFPTPERLKLLRKALNFFTQEEQGIVSPISEVYVGKAEATRNAEEYGRAMLINNLADKKIRDSLANIYQIIKASLEDEVSSEIDKKQKRLKDEKEKQEKIQEELKEENRANLGENL